jgi:hypothetical protein
MKIAIVPYEALTARTLRGADYADPTREVDANIATTRRALRNAELRLARLEQERAAILAGQVRRLYPDRIGRLRWRPGD